MADTTDILGLRVPSADGSDTADLAAIIGNLGADVDAAVGNPTLTTAQINALTGDAKAAGRRVWDSTLGVEKVSNGTTWEIQATKTEVDARLPLTGGTLTGDIRIAGTANERGLGFMDDEGDLRFWWRYEKTVGRLALRRYDGSGVYIDGPLTIESTGQVISNSHVGGFATLTPDAFGQATHTIPTAPDDAGWSVTVEGALNSYTVGAKLTDRDFDSITVFFYNLATGAAVTTGSYGINWHAIAYGL